jgi:hypothetical protein
MSFPIGLRYDSAFVTRACLGAEAMQMPEHRPHLRQEGPGLWPLSLRWR